MKKSTIKVLGERLRREFKPPEDLPHPLRQVLQALAEVPYEEQREQETQACPKASCGH